jgi:Ser/Thr protein kinase RdoA (MazF antagonist)
MINKSRGTDPQPFSGLSPEVVLDAAAEFGLEPDGRLFALNSYENRVYQVGAGERQLVLKFYRPARWSDAQIREEHQFTHELAAAELPVAAPLSVAGETLLRYREFRFAAFPWMRGRAPELDAPEARQMLGRTLARLHQIGATRAFAVRPRIGVQRLGWEARAQLLASELLPEALRERYSSVSGALLERVSAAFAAAATTREIRLHGDCHLGNLLWNEHGPVFVDLDDCAMGVRVQDLWMMLAGPPAEQQRQWGELLEGYGQFADFDFLELTLIEPLRSLRMLHHAAWVVQRWSDPAFPRAFPWAAEPRYWEGYLVDLLEQIPAIDDPPILQR